LFWSVTENRTLIGRAKRVDEKFDSEKRRKKATS